MIVTYRTVKTAVVLWATLSIVVAGFSGMVICISEDGHFAMEIAHHGRCDGQAEAPTHGGQPSTATLCIGDSDGGGDCVDLSLPVDSMSHSVTKLRRADTLKGSLSRLPVEARVAATDASIRPGAPSVPRSAAQCLSPSLRMQSTIVLRI